MRFLLLSKVITNYTKKDIDCGLVPPKIYEICCCIRETFCLSYSIRKNSDLFLYFVEEKIVIKFIGTHLRYLGPDERSQAILLLKALKKRNKAISTKKWINSTPGIYIKQYENHDSFLLEFFGQYMMNFCYYVSFRKGNVAQNVNLFLDTTLNNLDQTSGFIFPLYHLYDSNPIFFNTLLDNKTLNLKVIYLTNIHLIQDKIICVNHYLDCLEENLNKNIK
ncbi:MAG: tRNA (Pseudouridine(54)-N(1))-methyltransferase [Promethearchaeota archaeon]|nr:MAG: tRNA (Pseudouridine(54)-N(1))-methyltransferase [Candidatus Lokiarchaeota archaeon]